MSKKVLSLDFQVRQFEQVTVSTTAVGVTSSYVRQGGAIITVEGGPIRWRADGTAVTATVGHELEEGATLILHRSTTLANLSMIRTGDVDATVSISHLG